MVFNRHLKALNLCNHSDTIACVLYELLVNLELINVGFQTHDQGSTSFSFVQFSRSCCAVTCFVTACILYLIKVLLSRTFMRYFLKPFGFKIPIQAVVTSFSGCPLARQLDYYSKEYDLCQALFSVFLTKFLLYFWARCILWCCANAAPSVGVKGYTVSFLPHSLRGSPSQRGPLGGYTGNFVDKVATP